jgi:hypothetical protein
MEPAHIHVETPEGECKFWLDPVRLARNKGVSAHVLRDLEKLAFEHQQSLKEKYDEFHKR